MSQQDTDETRNRLPPIPADLHNVLTENQFLAVQSIESFGWSLRFVRREGKALPIVVVSNPTGQTLGILEEDGRLNLQHNMKFRP
jgi:hypothetical protein